MGTAPVFVDVAEVRVAWVADLNPKIPDFLLGELDPG
jgi:hypothetical protein